MTLDFRKLKFNDLKNPAGMLELGRYMTYSNTQKKQWHSEEIKAAIRMKRASMSEFAKASGLSESAMSKALKTPNLAAEKAISTLLNVPLHELWPNRWTTDGKRIYPRYANKYSTKSELVA